MAMDATKEPQLSVKESGSYAYGVHVGYAVQFHRNVGLGVGLDFSRYGSATSIQGDKMWMGVYDTEGEKYNHLLRIYSLTDQMQQYYLNIPLSLRFTIPMGRTAFELQLGAKAGLPISSSATYQGDVEHIGDYSPWGMIVSNVPNHGFYRTQDVVGRYAMPKGLQVFAFAKLGLLIPLPRHLQLTAHVGVDYGVLSSPVYSENSELGCSTGDVAHTFMPGYKGIFATHLADGTTHPLSLTAELGLRIVIEHVSRYDCRCYMW